MLYFGVYIPKPEGEATEKAPNLIFTEKTQALDVLRQHKEARLRCFSNREQAESYVRLGFEEQKHPQEAKMISGERSPFHAPTKQELQAFRKQIEAGNLERVRQIVWENPCYLISRGDTPTCLKEGPRYNAMHVCAQQDRPSIAELLLDTVADPEFAQLYTDKEGSPEMCADLAQNLLDLYLNMPDKARGETPLHFAAKLGKVDVVEVLVGYPQCKSLPNREGKEPKDIICQRNEQAPPETLQKLDLLLGDPYYVPVLRSWTHEVPPHVGPPYSPKQPPRLKIKKEESEGLSVELSITALAGPMSRDKAMQFYRRWKTPPRLGSETSSPLANLPFTSPVKMRPSGSGLSPISRRMLFGSEEETPTEESPIQDLTMNLSTSTLNDSFRERHIKNSDIGKGLEVVGRQLARQEQLEWREYWKFLDAFVDFSSKEGLELFEAYLHAEKAKWEDMKPYIGMLQLLMSNAFKPWEEDEVIQTYDFSFDCMDNCSSDDDDGYKTPLDNIPYRLFINGNKPTKCDLDVLNVIFNAEVDKNKMPFVHAWKTAMEGFSTEEMELFPLPTNEQKIHKPGLDNNKSAGHNYQTSIHPKGLFGAQKL